jgi:hypothetical protein
MGNLSAHALQFARFKRKRLEASKYSNLIFERCIGVFSLVFSANQKNVNLLHYWEGEEGIWERNLIHRNCLGFRYKCPIIPTIDYSVFWDEWIISQYKVYVLRSSLNHIWFWGSLGKIYFLILFFLFHCANLHPHKSLCIKLERERGKRIRMI